MKSRFNKFFALILSVLMLCSLCGCKSSDENHTENTPNNKIETDENTNLNEIHFLYDKVSLAEEIKTLQNFSIEPQKVYSSDIIDVDFTEVYVNEGYSGIYLRFNITNHSSYDLKYDKNQEIYINGIHISTSGNLKDNMLEISFSAKQLVLLGITEIETIEISRIGFSNKENYEPLCEFNDLFRLETSLMKDGKTEFTPEVVVYNKDGVAVSMLKASTDENNGVLYLPIIVENNTDDVVCVDFKEDSVYINDKYSGDFLVMWGGFGLKLSVLPGKMVSSCMEICNFQFEDIGTTIDDDFDLTFKLEKRSYDFYPVRFADFDDVEPVLSDEITVRVVH